MIKPSALIGFSIAIFWSVAAPSSEPVPATPTEKSTVAADPARAAETTPTAKAAPPDAATEKVAAPSDKPATQPSADDSAKPSTEVAEAKAQDPVICRAIASTGSRLRTERICKSKSQWRQDEEDAQRFMRDTGNAVNRGGDE